MSLDLHEREQRQVTRALSQFFIDFDSISIDTENGPYFGTSDISGDRGNVYDCTALDHDGKTVSFTCLGSGIEFDTVAQLAGCF